MSKNDLVLQTDNVTKDIKMGKVMVHALRGVSMSVQRGEFLGVIGPSGSGKSTLLGLIGGLDSPTDGKVYIDGQDITSLNENELTRVRNEKIGFVFQFFNLVPTLTALENVSLPIQFARKRKFSPTQRSKELLEMLGMGDRMNHRPNQLSGGQQQRVAIARALANEPPLLLTDEPTGSLDSEAGEVVMKALRDIRDRMGTTVIIVTHDTDVASRMDRLITLADGRVVKDDIRTSAQMATVQMLKDKRRTGEMSAVGTGE
jgi:putative ABC transport system ATP-binding protein